MRHLAVSVALVAAVILLAGANHCKGREIFVSSNGTSNDTACWTKGPAHPCGSLELALEGAHNVSNTTVLIEPGIYTLSDSQFSVFDFVKDITIAGTGEVIVNCAQNAGLSFYHSTNIVIANVSFYGCGYEHVSTSQPRNTTGHYFRHFKVSLFFQQCLSVTLTRVGVSNSKGIAVQFYATLGHNRILHSFFTDNTGEGGKSVGGGVYIEYPYCLPGDLSCNESVSNIPLTNISGGSYYIAWSNFSNNIATNDQQTRVFMVPFRSNHEAFGRGGGLSVFFKGQSNLAVVEVFKCNFYGNAAIFGGGMFVDFQDNCSDNSVSVVGCHFDNNTATQQGGGLRLNLIFLDDANVNNNTMFVGWNHFYHNSATSSGGGMYLGATRENSAVSTNNLTISDSTWIENVAPIGAAVTMAVWHQIPQGATIMPILANCSFTSNRVKAHTSATERALGKGTVYLDSISIDIRKKVNFTSNEHSAIAGANTGIYFNTGCQAGFYNNVARSGAAIALLGNAYVTINENTKFVFIKNSASYLGGAIYAASLTGQDSIYSGNCFLRYHNMYTSPTEWKTTFYFHNNKAMGRNNSIYASSLDPCLWGRAFGPVSTDNLIDDVFCWNNVSTIWDYGEGVDCADEIMSAASRFLPGPNEAPSISVVPGKWQYFNLSAFDDHDNNVTDYAVLLAKSDTQGVVLGNRSQYLGSNSIQVNQMDDSVKTATIILQTFISPNPILTELNVTFKPCPPGFNLSNGECVCQPQFQNLLICLSDRSEIQRGYWIGSSPYDNSTTVMAHCPLCYYSQSALVVEVENYTEVQNKLCYSRNRTGILCSECREGNCPAVNSEIFDCVWYDEYYSLPLRIFFFFLNKLLFSLLVLWIIYRFGIRISSGRYNAPVFFAQVVTTVVAVDADGIIPYPHWLRKTYFILYDIWNLELRLPDSGHFCLYPDMPVTLVIALNYCVAVLPLTLVIFMYILYQCKDSGKLDSLVDRCNVEVDSTTHSRRYNCCTIVLKSVKRIFIGKRDYVISAIAAFFVLSYMKIAVTTCLLLTPARLIGDERQVLYMDGGRKYPEDVRVYLIIAAVFSVFLLMVPLLLFFLRYNGAHPEGFMQRLLQGLQADLRSFSPNRKKPYIKQREPYVGQRNPLCCCSYEVHANTTTELCNLDVTFPGNFFCFTSFGPDDFRWVSGAYFALRLCMLLPFVLSVSAFIHLCVQMVIACAAAAFFIVFKPYGTHHKEAAEANLQDVASDDNHANAGVAGHGSDWYNKLDAFVFILLAAVIGLSLYQYHLSIDDNPDSTWALVTQSVLLLLPAFWFGGWAFYSTCVLINDMIWACRRQRQGNYGRVVNEVPNENPQ